MPKRWTEEEEKFLKENYKKMSYQEIGLILGKKTTQVKQKRETLGLCCKLFIKQFTQKEFDFVQDNYPRFSKKDISKKMNITISRVGLIIKKLEIIAKKVFFKHDYLSMLSISKILNLPITFIRALIKCKFIKISSLKSEKRVNLNLVHIDEFEKIKDFLNNYISVQDFIKEVFFTQKTISYRIKTGKIKDFLKVGSKYFIHKNEIEIQRSL